MVIVCPGCKANFVINDSQVTPQGVKLRCCRCKAVFKIIRKKRTPGSGVAGSSDRPTHVVKFVVAHESQSFCEAVKRVVANEPFLVYDSNDGGEAMAIIERIKPDAVLLDVALPTMYGFEICEAIRRNAELAHTKVILLAAIYDKRRYRRDPASLYGADEVIEKHRIPDELIRKVYSLVQAGSSRVTAIHPVVSAVSEPTVQHADHWLEAADAPVGAAWEDAALPTVPEENPGAEWHAASTADKGDPLPCETSFQPVAVPDTGSGSGSDATHLVTAELPVIEIEEEPEQLPAELAGNFIDEVTVEAAHSPEVPLPAGPVVAEDLPEDRIKARRLARIIISDIALYNPEKVTRGIKEGTMLTLLADEIAEGEALYAQRVAAEIRSGTDYLGEALQKLIEKKKKEYAV